MICANCDMVFTPSVYRELELEPVCRHCLPGEQAASTTRRFSSFSELLRVMDAQHEGRWA